MALTIYTDGAGNKYLGYAGDITDIATGSEIEANFISLLSDFGINAVLNSSHFGWRDDGVLPSGVGGNSSTSDFEIKTGYFNSMYRLSSNDVDNSQSHIIESANSGSSTAKWDQLPKGVMYSNGVDVGVFGWDTVNSYYQFIWVGGLKGNSNIATPQNRSGITIVNGGSESRESIGVKQGDTTTKRTHLDTEAGANHLIDCGTDTGRLYLIEDDGTGGDGGAVGYCENLYLSKKAGLTIGGFVTIDGITDGGSEQGIVVGQWGDNAHLIMRVYDGVS